MSECIGQYYILNGTLKPETLFDSSDTSTGISVYEVIRLRNGAPVFFRDHYERLVESAGFEGKKMLADYHKLKKDIVDLAGTFPQKEINVKIVFNYKAGQETYLAYFIKSYYPSDDNFRHGVPGILFHASRSNPNTKLVDATLRSRIDKQLSDEGAWEALLVNEHDEITEGSRSNLFFFMDGSLFTAPDSMILKGITRKYVIRICHETGIPVNFRPVRADELKRCQSVFLTGTSPTLLPFYRINDLEFETEVPLITEIRKRYVAVMDLSVRDFQDE